VQPLTAGERARGIGFDGITINVYGAPGQNEEELAEIVSRRLQTNIQQLEGVW